jgi:hypothetical protein
MTVLPAESPSCILIVVFIVCNLFKAEQLRGFFVRLHFLIPYSPRLHPYLHHRAAPADRSVYGDFNNPKGVLPLHNVVGLNPNAIR